MHLNHPKKLKRVSASLLQILLFWDYFTQPKSDILHNQVKNDFSIFLRKLMIQLHF